jgi:DNA-binding MarR family transcriptional regulator
MDAVDELVAQWERERPDLDLWPVGIVGRLSRLSRLVERALKDFFAEHALEPWEFDVLATLRRAGEPYELTPGALLKAAMVTSGAMTNRIDRMESKGLVDRIPDPNDRRSVRIRLTENGHVTVDRLIELHVANEARLLSALTPTQREQLTSTLRRLLESLGDASLQ